MEMTQPTSERLTCRRLDAGGLGAFHQIVLDAHVRRYLVDGEAMSREWCREQLAASDALFASCGLGLWLVFRKDESEKAPIGLCGFVRFAETGPEPQLLYALLERHTGQGFATEIARTLVEYAVANTSLSVLHSAADEPNIASLRVLEKAGFEQVGTRPGAFGQILTYRLPLVRRAESTGERLLS
jgi:RimJ/RimL family protein N-acetyltransferase